MNPKITVMEINTNAEQPPGKPESGAYASEVATGSRDHRLPHEIAAAILAAAYEVVVKRLAWERETGH
jgi:hypothetical protein